MSQPLFDRINEVAKECSREGWDGYGAWPVTQAHLEAARKFVATFPEEIPTPSVGCMPSGDLSFEWYNGRGRVLWASVGEDGGGVFAWTQGDASGKGTFEINGAFDPGLKETINRIYA